MTTGRAVCLCMIVKNEAHVIRRCLASARPLIDHWIVVDTGSTDGTQDVVREAMLDLPGELLERPWVDFGHNRSEALALARPHGDYSLIIDADDEIVLPSDFSMPMLEADSYTVDVQDGGIALRRPQMVRNTRRWRYRGVLHEVLECPEATSQGHLPIVMRIHREGRRHIDPTTGLNDAATLERVLETETDAFLVSRYTFYLAQTYRDCGKREKARDAYLRRADLGFSSDEVFVALYQAGLVMEQLGHPPDEVLAVYARASAAGPSRAEAAHAASRLCRSLGRNAQGAEVAEPALGLAAPPGALGVEPWIYEYGLRDEFAVNAYWAGRYAESLEQMLLALACEKLPAGYERFVANARFAFERMTKGASSWPPDAAVPSPWRTPMARLPEPAPRVLVALLAKQKAPVLPFFLERLAAFDYPKDRMVLYVRTNNNTDDTRDILVEWLAENGHLYAGVEFDDTDLPTRVEGMAVHDWNPTRLAMIRAIRNEAMAKTAEHDCRFFLPIDIDNFVAPCTLRELVALDLPIVAPLIREARAGAHYANYHAKIDAYGYYAHTPRYDEIFARRITGLFELPVVHCTYLVRADVIPKLSYEDGSGRYDYVIFCDRARRAGVPQYLDNRQLYGYLTLQEDVPEIVAEQLKTLADWFSRGADAGEIPY